MTRIDEPISLADQIEVALLTIAAHEGERRCVNCSAGVCGVWWWALKVLERHPGLHRLRTDFRSDQTT
ncbi:hypothetical protein [Micromonospora eburnea]|uniref:Uncharacterized protein n=1 Tax=Micromonospora eburnea TaxID=227316 RepID=A0A1C6UXE6_9ACTN|nr:hypothetical protein [Micromonospora eburnea]SCL58626.1 hypothetical protein GA0070604_3877 [Micromonospora eburnea]